jgi:hypothetical protein
VRGFRIECPAEWRGLSSAMVAPLAGDADGRLHPAETFFGERAAGDPQSLRQ